jgi:hypothetical protein
MSTGRLLSIRERIVSLSGYGELAVPAGKEEKAARGNPRYGSWRRMLPPGRGR